MTIEVVINDGTGVEYHYTMHDSAEQLISEFAEGMLTEITMVEKPPEIRRNFPMQLKIKRVS